VAELPPTVQALAALVRELGPELRVKTHRTAKVVTCTVSSPEDVLVLRQHGAGWAYVLRMTGSCHEWGGVAKTERALALLLGPMLGLRPETLKRPACDDPVAYLRQRAADHAGPPAPPRGQLVPEGDDDD
jgi:hypothetical protein